MNIALINPKTDVFDMRMIYETHENLTLGLIASYLENKDHSVCLIDLTVQRTNEIETAQKIISDNIEIVGISINYATFPSAIEIAQEIKLLDNNILWLILQQVTQRNTERNWQIFTKNISGFWNYS